MEQSRFPRPYRHSPDQDASRPARHRVIIVSGGPVGLALAADLGVRGGPCVLVDGKSGFGEGSRGLCYAKRMLEVLDRRARPGAGIGLRPKRRKSRYRNDTGPGREARRRRSMRATAPVELKPGPIAAAARERTAGATKHGG